MMMLDAQAMMLNVHAVHVVAHQVAAIDEQQDENQHDGQPDAVAHLREDQNFPQRRPAESE